MKKIFFIAIIATVLLLGLASCGKQNKPEETTNAADMHTSKISIDFQGIYRGTTPAADCEGIQTTLTLSDSTYVLEMVYVGKSKEVFKDTGNFTWNEDGNCITLDNDKNGFRTQYRVGENVLLQLDNEGKEIKGEFAEMYILHKDMK